MVQVAVVNGDDLLLAALVSVVLELVLAKDGDEGDEDERGRLVFFFLLLRLSDDELGKPENEGAAKSP